MLLSSLSWRLLCDANNNSEPQFVCFLLSIVLVFSNSGCLMLGCSDNLNHLVYPSSYRFKHCICCNFHFNTSQARRQHTSRVDHHSLAESLRIILVRKGEEICGILCTKIFSRTTDWSHLVVYLHVTSQFPRRDQIRLVWLTLAWKFRSRSSPI